MIRPAARTALLLAAFLLLPRLAAAQATPEQAAAGYFATVRSGDWPANAARTHPQALSTMKAMFVELAGIDTAGVIIGPMLGVQRSAELTAMEPSLVYQRVLNMVMTMQPQVREIVATSTFEPVGHVVEGDTAHVVYRMRAKIEGVDVTQTSVISMRRDAGEWKALLTGDVQNLISALRTALQGSPLGPRDEHEDH
jgi:hypothetical protein